MTDLDSSALSQCDNFDRLQSLAGTLFKPGLLQPSSLRPFTGGGEGKREVFWVAVILTPLTASEWTALGQWPLPSLAKADQTRATEGLRWGDQQRDKE